MLIAASATVLGAQAITTPGTRVRVVRTPGTHVLQVGVLERLNADSVAVRDAQGWVRVLPLGGTMRLDVSRGRQRRILPGMLIGGAAGAVGGLLVGVALDQSADREADALCAPNCANGQRFLDGIEVGIGAAVGTGIGVVVGGIVGAMPHERWQAATLPQGVTLALDPRGRWAIVRFALGQQRQ
ncbi:hypothetical protein [Gemmatimonas phototrophica]|nr:hypothetical protein [Gemmatimonas phototrophica]